ncbi:MAG: endonuclease, partial [Acidobacteriota bacterium]|nr:endonuclease [Acidobacteriota bacterium]
MPYYAKLKRLSEKDRKRIVAGIQRLRLQFDQNQFPYKKTDRSLILGTWNIRNFDDDRFNYGPRTEEALYYIAEIISRFDVIAVQEVCEDVSPLDRVIGLLGRQYDYILTDVTHSSLGGNKERLGFIYDRDKVRFRGIAGEIVLPEKMLISETTDKKRQFARTPFGVEV